MKTREFLFLPVDSDPSRTQALILTDSCPIPPLIPSMGNQSMLLPPFLRDTNITGFPEWRPPPLEYEMPSNTNSTTAGPIITTTPETLSTAITQHTSLQSTPIPTVPLNTSLSSNSSLGLGFTTASVTKTLTNTTQSFNTAAGIQSAISDQVQVQNTTLQRAQASQASIPPRTRCRPTTPLNQQPQIQR